MSFIGLRNKNGVVESINLDNIIRVFRIKDKDLNIGISLIIYFVDGSHIEYFIPIENSACLLKPFVGLI